MGTATDIVYDDTGDPPTMDFGFLNMMLDIPTE